MADINLVGNLFTNLAPAEKGEGASEGSVDPQSPGTEAAGTPFSPILAQFIAAQAALVNGTQPKNPDLAELPQLAGRQAEKPEKLGPEVMLGKELGKVAQSNPGPVVLALAVSQASSVDGLTPGPTSDEGQNAAVGASVDLTALMKAALGKKLGSSIDDEPAAATVDMQKAAANESTSHTEKRSDGSVEKSLELTKAGKLPPPLNDPQLATQEKSASAKTIKGERLLTTLNLVGQQPEVEAAPIAAPSESGKREILGAPAEVTVNIQRASVEFQKTQLQQKESSLDGQPLTPRPSIALPILKEGTPLIVKTLSGQNPLPLMMGAEVTVNIEQASVEPRKTDPQQEKLNIDGGAQITKPSVVLPILKEGTPVIVKTLSGQNPLPLMMGAEVTVNIQRAAVEPQKTDPQQEKLNIDGGAQITKPAVVLPILKEGTPLIVKTLSGQNPLPSMMRVDSSQTTSQSAPDGAQLEIFWNQLKGSSSPPSDLKGLADVTKPMFQSIGLAAKQKENKDNIAQQRILTTSEPLIIEKIDAGGSAPDRVGDTISRLAKLTVDDEVAVKNELAKTLPVGTTAPTGSGSKEESAAQVNTALPNVVSTARPKSNEGKSTEESSAPSVATLKSDVGRVAFDKENRTGSNEKEHESKQLTSSAKDDVRASGASQESADSKVPYVAQGTTAKEHADALKHLAASLTTKVETRQDVQQTLSVKPLPLPSELLSSLHDQIAKEIALKVAGNISEIRVMLKPESLGSVTVHVRMEEGTMVARIDVSQQNVKTALEANLPQLRETLVSKGIQVDRIDVTTSAFASSRESNNQQRDRAKSGLKRSEDTEAVESYEGARFLGYNTLDYLV